MLHSASECFIVLHSWLSAAPLHLSQTLVRVVLPKMQIDYRRGSDYSLDLITRDGYDAVAFDMRDGFVEQWSDFVRKFTPERSFAGLFPLQLRLNLSNYQAPIRSHPGFDLVDYIQAAWHMLLRWPPSSSHCKCCLRSLASCKRVRMRHR